MSTQNDLQAFRKMVNEFGREFAMTQDMIRLGMLELTKDELEILKNGNREIGKLRQESHRLNTEIKKLPDVESLIKKVRKLRIERVRKERAEKKKLKIQERHEKKAAEKKWRLSTPPYLGEGVSKGLTFHDTDIEKLKALDLATIQNIEELGNAMGIAPNKISWLSYHRNTSSIDHYYRFKIPKKKGGSRHISSPKPLLRIAQSWILENILEKIPLHDAAMAFRSNLSIADNANKHKDQGVVIRIDLKDFFPSIKFRRVKGLFKSFGYNEGLSTVFALICTDAKRMEAQLDGRSYFVALSDRYLPQGACTSPTLTNVLCRNMDKRMQGLAQKFGFTYTRYADDLVFSHPDKNANVKTLITCVKSIIKQEGLTVHPEKVNVMRPHQRQNVTGIIVNETPKVSRRDMRNFRSFLHHLKKSGVEAMSQKMGKNALNYAQGYWAFINMVNPDQAAKLLEKHAFLKA